ncbi:chemotaxis protein CheA [Herbaspirillum sp. NPDC087042]|uniref:chemotaxis protein CheA n=1 Tax=Herbaspirillum sp. NPDC087042 TaxID=3364004 RepID=UPI003822F841
MNLPVSINPALQADPFSPSLQDTVRPLLKIVRQQGSSWRARVESGLRCAAPALYLRSLVAVRDYARSVHARQLEDASSAMVQQLEQLQENDAGIDAGELDMLEQAVAAIVLMVEQGGAPARSALVSTTVTDDSAQSVQSAQDLLDTGLLPVFLEEAQELMDSIGDGLQAARQGRPDPLALDALARPLHTLKGSARMVGALRLSHCLHEMESVLRHRSPHRDGGVDMAALHALYGQAQDHFVALEQRVALDAVPREGATPSRGPVIRIKTSVLDRLLNQVGEVAISRSHLENEVAALQRDSRALGEHLATLAQQLRQLQATPWRTSGGHDDEAAQQGLAQTLGAYLDEVGMCHRQLQLTVGKTREGLRQQARYTRDLQQELMSARMVRFDSIRVRLQHLVRQVAVDAGKPLQLNLADGGLQIDRAILERLMGPLEHLLRNAAVHGIEGRSERLAAGKQESGQLSVQARHEGNEAVIRISDDGRGLDLESIRRKALQLGLPGAASATEARLAELIFAPGLSTSPQLSALAGRGIGMDVVRAEVAALGGWMTVHSQPGQGVTLTLFLPLSLAVQHVCLLRHGQQHYAIPSMLIDSVQQLRGEQAAQALMQGTLSLHGRTLALHPLHALLDEPAVAAPSAMASSVYALLIKSGEERMAIMVDHVSGNREVVVKPVGPQLASLAGVVGATLLGDGQIVLILNPLLLAGACRPESMTAVAGVQ